MIAKNSASGKNPYLLTTLATAGAAAGYGIARYFFGEVKRFDPAELLVFAVPFWIVFFLVQRFILKRRGGA